MEENPTDSGTNSGLFVKCQVTVTVLIFMVVRVLRMKMIISYSEQRMLEAVKNAKFSLFSLTTEYDLLVHLRNSVIKRRVQSEETD